MDRFLVPRFCLAVLSSFSVACGKVEASATGSPARPDRSGRAVAFDATDCDRAGVASADSPEPGEVALLSSGSVAVRYPMVDRGWPGFRLELASARGPGAVVFAVLPRGACYLGRGAFRGWPQERLASLFRKLAPHDVGRPSSRLPARAASR